MLQVGGLLQDEQRLSFTGRLSAWERRRQGPISPRGVRIGRPAASCTSSRAHPRSRRSARRYSSTRTHQWPTSRGGRPLVFRPGSSVACRSFSPAGRRRHGVSYAKWQVIATTCYCRPPAGGPRSILGALDSSLRPSCRCTSIGNSAASREVLAHPVDIAAGGRVGQW